MHQLLHLALALCLIGAIGGLALAWRLDQGPIDVSWLSNRARAALIENGGPIKVSFKSAELAWGGLSPRLEHLLVLQFTDVAVQRADGMTLAQAPRAWTSFSLPALLTGRFIPRVAEVDDARVQIAVDSLMQPLDRQADETSADPRGVVRAIVQQINPADRSNSNILAGLRQVHLHNARLTMTPSTPALGAENINIDMVRQQGGHLVGVMSAAVVAQDQRSELKAHVDLPRSGNTQVGGTIGPIRPSSLDAWIKGLAGVDVPTSVDANLTLDTGFGVSHGDISIDVGAGSVRIARGVLPIQHGAVTLSGTPAAFSITRLSIAAPAPAGGPPALLNASGDVKRQAGHSLAKLTLGLQNVNLADLSHLWPDGVGGGGRAWVTENVKAGHVDRGSALFSIDVDEIAHTAKLLSATADVPATNATFTWLDKMPAVDQADVRLRLLDPDVMEVDVKSGRQRGADGGGDLHLSNGVVRISGLTARDQTASIRFRADGPVVHVISLLKRPRLHLLSDHPIKFKIDAGTATANLDFLVPLIDNVSMDEVGLQVTGRLSNVHAPHVVGEADFDAGSFALNVSKDGMRFDGSGALAQTPVKLQGTMDFTAGPPNQAVAKVVVTGEPDAATMRQVGLDLTGILGGRVPATATIVDRRRGPEEIAIDSDLTEGALTLGVIGWTKPAGVDAQVNAALTVAQGNLAGLDRLVLTGHNLEIVGSGRSTNNRLNSIVLDKVTLGQTRARGTVRFAPGEAINIVIAASLLDLQPKLTEKAADTPPDMSAPKTVPGWNLDARCARVRLANGVETTNVLIKGHGDGEAIRSLDTLGVLQGGSSFALKIQGAGGERHLRLDAQDGGLMLRGLDIAQVLQGGRLVVDGTFNDADRYAPISGKAEVYGPRLTQTPAVGKLLQAITIYGLADVMRGPGIGLTQIDVPFVYDGAAVNISNARAYNPSLGITVHGRIGTRAGRVDINGTVVPAYVLNSALGNLPVLGKLFSPEKGGGVFAVQFGVRGDLDNPVVTVNPASALTPGFLRGLFGAGGGATARRDEQTAP
jgi:hypothetical protein